MREGGVSVHLVGRGGAGVGQDRTRIKLYVSYVLSAIRMSLFGPPPDVNFFLTQPPLFFLWGTVLRVLRSQPYIVTLMDLYPEVLTASGMIRPRTPHAWFAGWIARVGYRHAAAVVVIGRCIAERVTRYGVQPGRIHLAPNWSNADVRPVDRMENPLRQELGIGNRFVVMYSGNMGLAHCFADIVEVARRLRDDDRIRFVFAGGGRRWSELARAREEGRLQNVILLPYQPVDRLSYSLALGDVHFVSLRAGFEGFVVPSKAYSVLEAGRGLIYQGVESGEIARLIRENDIGAVVPSDDAEALEREVLNALENRERVASWGDRAGT